MYILVFQLRIRWIVPNLALGVALVISTMWVPRHRKTSGLRFGPVLGKVIGTGGQVRLQLGAWSVELMIRIESKESIASKYHGSTPRPPRTSYTAEWRLYVTLRRINAASYCKLMVLVGGIWCTISQSIKVWLEKTSLQYMMASWWTWCGRGVSWPTQ